MRMAKIKFLNDEDDARGALELAKRTRIICLRNDEYVIPEQNLKILDDLEISYKLLEVTGWDYIYSQIRNSIAASV
ncbi:hypothetical protein H8E77_39545 [bacterium]|nr:hypothetical protein [bacterium]